MNTREKSGIPDLTAHEINQMSGWDPLGLAGGRSLIAVKIDAASFDTNRQVQS